MFETPFTPAGKLNGLLVVLPHHFHCSAEGLKLGIKNKSQPFFIFALEKCFGIWTIRCTKSCSALKKRTKFYEKNLKFVKLQQYSITKQV